MRASCMTDYFGIALIFLCCVGNLQSNAYQVTIGESTAQARTCINSKGELVGEGARDGSFICRSGTWVYSP